MRESIEIFKQRKLKESICFCIDEFVDNIDLSLCQSSLEFAHHVLSIFNQKDTTTIIIIKKDQSAYKVHVRKQAKGQKIQPYLSFISNICAFLKEPSERTLIVCRLRHRLVPA
jgi:hypothetical protein